MKGDKDKDIEALRAQIESLCREAYEAGRAQMAEEIEARNCGFKLTEPE